MKYILIQSFKNRLTIYKEANTWEDALALSDEMIVKRGGKLNIYKCDWVGYRSSFPEIEDENSKQGWREVRSIMPAETERGTA